MAASPCLQCSATSAKASFSSSAWAWASQYFPQGRGECFCWLRQCPAFIPSFPPSHCLSRIPPVGWRQQPLHSWDKTLSLLEVCGILLCSSAEEEDQDVMGQSYSELALLKRCSRERQSMLITALIQFWWFQAEHPARIGFSSALCPVPESSSSLGRICRCCHGWVSITGGWLESSACVISGPQVATKTWGTSLKGVSHSCGMSAEGSAGEEALEGMGTFPVPLGYSSGAASCKDWVCSVEYQLGKRDSLIQTCLLPPNYTSILG